MNWRKRIDLLEKGQGDFEAAKRDAFFWNCCGVGERREIFEAKGVEFANPDCEFPYLPKNAEINLLGGKFSFAIHTKDWNDARKYLDQMDSWISSHPTIGVKEDAEEVKV